MPINFLSSLRNGTWRRIFYLILLLLLARPQWAIAARQSQENVPEMLAASIVGPLNGEINKVIHFSAKMMPKEAFTDATNPIEYHWSPEPDQGQGTAWVSYHWSAPGTEIVKLIATDATGQTTRAVQEITIAQAALIPVQASSLIAPPDGATHSGESVPIRIAISPRSATQYEIHWRPEPISGQGKEVAYFSWAESGVHPVSALIQNSDGSQVEATLEIRVEAPSPPDATAVSTDSPTDLPTAIALLTPRPTNVATVFSPSAEPLGTTPALETVLPEVTAPATALPSVTASPPGQLPNGSPDPLAGTPSSNQTPEIVPTTPSVGTTPVSEPTGQAGAVGIYLPLIAGYAQAVQAAAGQAPTIVGGEESAEDAWPWQAALMLVSENGDSRFICGGSLIAPRWILTASHCLQYVQAANLRVVLGRHRLSDSGGETLTVRKIISHENFNRITFESDIALLELEQTSSRPPLSLNAPNFGPGANVTVTGWGTTISGIPSTAADALRQVTVPVVDWATCNQAYDDEITENMLCAGQTGRDACQGDSGGPLHLPVADSWVQVGIVSWGHGCGVSGLPGVYTDLAKFQSWLAEKMEQAPPPSGDSYEPDNTSAEASPIALGGSAYSHTFHVAGDLDWLYFETTPVTEYTIETANLQGDANTVIVLYGPDGSTKIDEDYNSAGNRASRLIWTAPDANRYYVQVRELNARAGASVGYDLTIVGREIPSEAVTDGHEPDNHPDEAKLMATDGTIQRHTIHQAGDQDWFTFSAAAGETYAIRTSNLRGATDPVMSLYQSNGRMLVSESDDLAQGEFDASVTWHASTDGPLFVRITHYDDRVGAPSMAYDLSISRLDTGTVIGDSDEPDNWPTQAATVATDGTVVVHTFHQSDDADWVTFTAEANRLYIMETSALQGAADTVLALYATNGTTLVASNDDARPGHPASRLVWLASESVAVHLKVSNDGVDRRATEMSYALSIRSEARISQATMGSIADIDESDNQMADAPQIETDGTQHHHTFHHPGDVDWVRFHSVSGATYRLTTSNLRGGADTMLTLYAADGSTILAENDDAEGHAARIEWVAPEAAEYLVKIHNYAEQGHPDAAYDFSILGEIHDSADAYEADDASGKAQLLTVNGPPQQHTFHSSDDEDWFQFTAIAGVTYRLETTNLLGNADTVLALYAQDGSTLLVENDDSGPSFGSRIDWIAPSAGLYYAKANEFHHHSGGAAFGYSISLTANPDEVNVGSLSAVLNGDFEEGAADWIEQSTNGYKIILSDTTNPPLQTLAFSGRWAAWLGGATDEISAIAQNEIRVLATAPYLRYWHWIYSEDGCGKDYGGVAVNGTWVHTYDLCSETITDGWVSQSIDLSAYAGQTVTLQIIATNDGDTFSNLFVDGVQFSSSAADLQQAESRQQETIRPTASKNR